MAELLDRHRENVCPRYPMCENSRYAAILFSIKRRNGVVRLASVVGRGSLLGMTSSNPYRGFRYPAEVIQQAVWLYHCFSLSVRDVELILATRGIVVSYVSIREWGLRFGRLFANALKRRRPHPGDKTVCLR